jgi:uncharacterized Zn ribbon protein
VTTRVIDVLPASGTHATRPAAAAAPKGAKYSCSDHGLIYHNDGAAWSTWAALGTVGAQTAEDVRDTIGTALVAGSNVTITVNDAGDTITIAAATDPETVRDTIGSALVAGSGMTITVNDAGDTITLTSSASGLDAEGVRDTIGAALVAGSGVAVVVDDSGDTITLTKGAATINAQTGTSYTLVIGDAPKFVTMSNASASTLTVPPNSSVAFPVGTQIEGAQLGAGQVTLTPGSGVTINGTPGLKVAAQYGTFGLLKTATDTWLAYGRLAA